MDIVVLCNGLGNQMSQYAFYLRKKEIDKTTCFIFDKVSASEHYGYELNKVFSIDYKEDFFTKVLCLIFRILGIKKLPGISWPLIKLLKLMGIKIIKENYNYDYDGKYLKPSKGLNFYYGGWHSEKYFSIIKNEVLNSFQFNISDDEQNMSEILYMIKSTNSVSIHVRRGDFVSEKHMNTFGAVCSKEYFVAAINKINSLVDEPHFFVFSNDVSWVKENIIHKKITIVDCNKDGNSWKDMYLISMCKHNINSNSSFSWWGAWMNANTNNIVIVPRFFINNLDTKDIYPAHWLQLANY